MSQVLYADDTELVTDSVGSKNRTQAEWTELEMDYKACFVLKLYKITIFRQINYGLHKVK